MFMHTLMKRMTFLMAVLIAACSPVDEITPRKYVGLVVAHTAPLKIEIAKALMASPGKSVPQADPLQLPPPSGLGPMKFDFGWVTTSGAIFVQDSKFAVVLLQEPTLDQGIVKWSCVVHPVEAKPNLCGTD